MDMIERIQKSAALVRDVGLIVGVPSIIYVCSQLYGLQQQSMQAQIGALNEQIEVLKERQYERAATVLKAQKEVSERELDAIQGSISVLGDKNLNLRDFNNRLLCLNLKNSNVSSDASNSEHARKQ